MHNKQNTTVKPDMVMHTCDPYIEETREEDCEFQASLCYVVRFFSK